MSECKCVLVRVSACARSWIQACMYPTRMRPAERRVLGYAKWTLERPALKYYPPLQARGRAGGGWSRTFSAAPVAAASRHIQRIRRRRGAVRQTAGILAATACASCGPEGSASALVNAGVRAGSGEARLHQQCQLVPVQSSAHLFREDRPPRRPADINNVEAEASRDPCHDPAPRAHGSVPTGLSHAMPERHVESA